MAPSLVLYLVAPKHPTLSAKVALACVLPQHTSEAMTQMETGISAHPQLSNARSRTVTGRAFHRTAIPVSAQPHATSRRRVARRLCFSCADRTSGCPRHDRARGLPTKIPRQNQSAEVQHELMKTIYLHEQHQNADAIVTLLSSEPVNESNRLHGSIVAHGAVFDVVGALLLAYNGFQLGDIKQKLHYLKLMKTLNEEDTETEERLEVEMESAGHSEAACLACYGQTPLHLQGQLRTLIDLYATDPTELLTYFIQGRYARWSSGYFPTRSPHPEELGDFPVAECLDRQPSRAEQLQQLGACNVVLMRPAEAVGQLNAALQMGLKTSLTYKYLAAAHAALGDDNLRDLHLEAAARVEPDSSFVTIHHLYMESVPETVSATGRFAMVNKRQQSYATHVSALQQAEQSSPLTSTQLIIRGCYQELLGNPAAALADLQKAMDKSLVPAAPSLYHMAAACCVTGRWPTALSVLDAALVHDSDNNDILRQRGLVKHQLGDYLGSMIDLEGRATTKAALWKLAASKLHLGFHESAARDIVAIRSL